VIESVIFYVCALAALGGALGLVLHVRNTVSAALCLLVTMLALAVLFVQLRAEFIGALQVMVYAGAIVVLFLFVIMLLNLRGGPLGEGEHANLGKWIGGAVVAAAGLKLGALLGGGRQIFGELDPEFGGVRSIAEVLYTDYLIAVEVSGVLLLVGIVGAMVLAKKELD
jgi:NADH-quinone oxidoreductase subunit J